MLRCISSQITTLQCLHEKKSISVCTYSIVNCVFTVYLQVFHPQTAVSVFDPVACVYIVHKKDDPTVECPIYAAVGK